MAKTFTENNESNRFYREEVLPQVLQAAKAGRDLDELDIPDSHYDAAVEDYERAKRSEGGVWEAAKGEISDFADEVKGMAKAYGETVIKRMSPYESVRDAEVAKNPTADDLDDMIDDMMSSAVDEPMQTLTDPTRGEREPIAAVMSMVPIVGGGMKVIKNLRKAKQLELPLRKRKDSGHAEIDNEDEGQLRRKKGADADEVAEADEDYGDPTMDDEGDIKASSDGKPFAKIPLKRRQITEEELPEITPLDERDYPEITPRGPAKKPELDDLLKDFLDEKPKSKVNIDDLIDEFMKFKSIDKPKDSGRIAEFRNKLKEKFKSGRITSDTADEAVAADWLAKDKAKRTSKPAEMRAASPDDFDIDEVTPSKWEEPKSMEKIDWADDADEVEDFSPVIKETPAGSIDPERIIRSLGADSKYAQQMAERAVKKIQGTVGKPAEQALAAKQFAQAEGEMSAAIGQLDGEIAQLEKDLAKAKSEIRAAQGVGRAPNSTTTKLHDSIMDELDSYNNARAVLVERFGPIAKRFKELETNAIKTSAAEEL